MDVGASTGGFTDVLLRRGVEHVIALDVGYGQLSMALRNDSRVTVLDRVNIRYVRPDKLPYRPDLVVIDTSFISLKLVLPAVLELVSRPAEIVALVKPQFEVGKGKVGKGGVVRDASARKQAVDKIVNFAEESGLRVVGVIESPLRGPAGNLEYLAAMRIDAPRDRE
jgi:23S rRNA (cytidine1920-2'-O)/16S rRNA (cytidine1409-2'-O)-methyltransferase